MRARFYRPNFDSLDSRFLLSDASAVLGGALAVSVTTVADPGQANVQTPNGTFAITNIVWNLPDMPPNAPYDPSIPPQGGID